MSFVVTGSKWKIDGLKTVLADQNVTPEECLFMGDDVIDMPVMSNVGIGVAVKSAVPEVLESATLLIARLHAVSDTRRSFWWINS